jgi:hypothetical protein
LRQPRSLLIKAQPRRTGGGRGGSGFLTVAHSSSDSNFPVAGLVLRRRGLAAELRRRGLGAGLRLALRVGEALMVFFFDFFLNFWTFKKEMLAYPSQHFKFFYCAFLVSNAPCSQKKESC